MLSDDQIRKIATLVNTLIDVPIIPEFMEQELFETAIRLLDAQLDQVLPAGLKQFINDATKTLDDAHTESLVDRLVTAISNRVDIPLLDENQQQKLFHTVIEVIVKSMSSKKTLDGMLSPVAA